MPGTERATRMFWSPDSQQIAFFVDGNLKKVALAGGPSRLVANGPFRDGVWGPNGTILVGGQQGRPLFRVSELGGEPTAVTALDGSLPEISHDYPEFLPDGSHYLYLARGTGPPEEWVTYLGALGSTERRPVNGIHSAMRYSPAAQVLLFLRGTTLLAQRFDRDRLELSGEPFPIAEQVAGTRVGTFSVAANGTLAFIGGAASDLQLTWFDRTGKIVGHAGPAAAYGSPTLSRDGRFVAFDRGSPADIWVMDVASGAATRFTSESIGQSNAVVGRPTVSASPGHRIAAARSASTIGRSASRETTGCCAKASCRWHSSTGRATAATWRSRPVATSGPCRSPIPTIRSR